MTHEYIFVDQRFNPRTIRWSCATKADRSFSPASAATWRNSPSGTRIGPPGDGMAERLLLQPAGRGSIASYASTGYEWAARQRHAQPGHDRRVVRESTAGRRQDRWILGEVITAGKVLMLSGSPGDPGAHGARRHLHLLGDPSMPMEMAPPRWR